MYHVCNFVASAIIHRPRDERARVRALDEYSIFVLINSIIERCFCIIMDYVMFVCNYNYSFLLWLLLLLYNACSKRESWKGFR